MGIRVGRTNLDFQMEQQYLYKRKNDVMYLINLKRPWGKLLLAAQLPEKSADISVVVTRNAG